MYGMPFHSIHTITKKILTLNTDGRQSQGERALLALFVVSPKHGYAENVVFVRNLKAKVA